MLLPGERAGRVVFGAASTGSFLRPCYAVPGTDVAHGAICLRSCFVVCGTDVAYGAISAHAMCGTDIVYGGGRGQRRQ
eukprot:855779-Rhodomonas_salina.4